MSYATSDFVESLNRVGIAPDRIRTVVAAWGSGSGQGEDTGKGWSAESVTDWSGGFLLKLKNGRYAYLFGWCDYTGWGCQDGAYVRHYDSKPSYEDLDRAHVDQEDDADALTPHRWDESPADLNKWLADGAKDPDE